MDTVPAEIDEFYGYSEVLQFHENQVNFHKNYDGGIVEPTNSGRCTCFLAAQRLSPTLHTKTKDPIFLTR
jgi:hypothetical protein